MANENENQVNNHAYFYNSQNGDRKYNADGHSDFMSPFFAPGVFEGSLQVTANDNMTVTIAPGYAWVPISGSTVKRLRHFTEPITIDIETASGTLDRIDTIVIRRDDTERDVIAAYTKGSLSSEPVPTAPTRSGATYELVIAQISVPAGTVRIDQSMITDTRMDPDLCGYVCATVEEIDFTQITAQFEQFFTNYELTVAERFEAFNDYIELLKQNGDTEYQSLLTEFQTLAAAYQQQFTDLYDEMENLIDGATAAHLQLEIDDTNESMFNRYYGLINSQANIIKENGRTIRVEAANDEAAVTTTFASDPQAGTKTINSLVVPVNGQYQYRKVTVITYMTDRTVVQNTYTRELKD